MACVLGLSHLNGIDGCLVSKYEESLIFWASACDGKTQNTLQPL